MFRLRCNAPVYFVTLALGLMVPGSSHAQVVPGSGQLIEQVGDDFEDEAWKFIHNHPKGSKEQDKVTRPPTGRSVNNRWYEGPMRGQPDVIERIATPPGGLEGSEGALLLQTLRSGVPNYRSGVPEQDDFVANCRVRLGGYISVARTPSCVTHVYLPPFEQWEKRRGASFGFRAGVYGEYLGPPRNKKPESVVDGLEEYWPGMFVRFNPKQGEKSESATILVRANNRGQDMEGPQIDEPGWWTMGMSFTPDGRVHYYAHAGVEPLTSSDYLTSSLAYSIRCKRFSTVFFNVINRDDGRSWSTPWVIDDTEIYVLHPNTPVARRK